MSKHHDTPAWLRAIQRDGGPVREALGFRIVANPSVPEGRIEWRHEQGDSSPYQSRAVPLREVGSAAGAPVNERCPCGDFLAVYAAGKAPNGMIDAKCSCGAWAYKYPAPYALQAPQAPAGMDPGPKAPRAAGDPAERPEMGVAGSSLDGWLRDEGMPGMADPIVAKTCALLLSRSALGVRKYGTTLARTDLSRKDWLVHARNEALDMALYLQRLIDMEDGE